MLLPGKITALLTGLTTAQLSEMRPVDRQSLAAECERVRRLIDCTRAAVAPSRAEFLAELGDGRGRE
jgi:hypothetical protein